MKIRDLKERVDQFLAASQLTPAEKLGLEAYAAVQAHLRSEGAAPNNKQLQKFRRGLIMDQLSPVDPADLETIQALEDGLTIDDLEAEKDLFRNIALRQARWVAAALQPLAPTGEKDAVHEAIRVSIDQFMARKRV